MSVATPGGSSQSPAVPSPGNQDAASNVPATDRVILEYLRSRGHANAAKALLEEIEAGTPDDSSKQAETVTRKDVVEGISVYADKPSRPGDNVLKDSKSVLQELGTMGNPPNIQALIASIETVGAEDILLSDPTYHQEGFRELEAWVDGSLDMYRVCACTMTLALILIGYLSRNFDPYSSQYSAISTST